jgi:hypothetical protein
MTYFSFMVCCALGLFLAFLPPTLSHGGGKSPNQSLEPTAGHRDLQV